MSVLTVRLTEGVYTFSSTSTTPQYYTVNIYGAFRIDKVPTGSYAITETAWDNRYTPAHATVTAKVTATDYETDKRDQRIDLGNGDPSAVIDLDDIELNNQLKTGTVQVDKKFLDIDIRNICLCLDNDSAGRTAAKEIASKLRSMGYVNVYERYPNEKDYNDELKKVKSIINEQAEENEQ